MRIYGRTLVDPLQPDGPKKWVEVTTDANGFNDAVNITWMTQAFQLNLNESPAYGDWGIPAKQAVAQQIAPDIYVSRMQQRFAPYFAVLVISKQPGNSPPTYNVNLITHTGAVISGTIPT